MNELIIHLFIQSINHAIDRVIKQMTNMLIAVFLFLNNFHALLLFLLNERYLYFAEDDRLRHLRTLAFDLVKKRKQILSGALPNDEQRRIQYEAVQELDEGNNLLGQDTIIRDEDGVAVNLDDLSLPETFRLFKEASTRSVLPLVKQSETYSMPCCLMVTVRSVTWRVGENAELMLSLYDEAKQAFITENCVLEYQRDRALHGEKAVFVDLKRFAEPAKIFLVCHIVRRGSMEWKESETKKPVRPF